MALLNHFFACKVPGVPSVKLDCVTTHKPNIAYLFEL